MRMRVDDREAAGQEPVRGGEYVMAENDTDVESKRLRLLEQWLDPGTTRLLAQLGVAPGWRCLEVGAGRGSITRWLSDRVGPTGSVVAADIDPRFLTEAPDNVEVRQLDIRQDEVEAGGYNLAHCRALLMHLPDPDAALARMVSALRPGGVLLIEEGDFGLHSFDGHPDAARMNELFGRVFGRLRAAHVMDGSFGRTALARLQPAGLELLGSDVQTGVAAPGDAGYAWEWDNMVAAGPRLVAAGFADEELLTLGHDFFGRPGTTVTTMTMVAAWGRKSR